VAALKLVIKNKSLYMDKVKCKILNQRINAWSLTKILFLKWLASLIVYGESETIWFVSGHAGHNGGVCQFIG